MHGCKGKDGRPQLGPPLVLPLYGNGVLLTGEPCVGLLS